MKILILADIHSNIEALKEVFLYIKSENLNFNRCFILGDMVGYGASPNECIKFIRNIPSCRIVPGNHEWGITGKIHLDYFNENARRAILWTKNKLTEVHYDFISKLSLTEAAQYNSYKYLFLHASPINKIEEYMLNDYKASLNFKAFSENICFFGHTHIPVVYLKNKNKVNSFYLSEDLKIEIKSEYRYLINVGSVGQPRDRDPRVSFGILDSVEKTITVKRLEYDIKTAQKKILDAGLPTSLARRLDYGF